MNQKIIHIGLDVDDNSFHGCAFDRETGELRNFMCRPTAKGLSTNDFKGSFLVGGILFRG